MMYINEVSKIAGISTRTLRYYDQINLLKPSFIDENGYRLYSDNELDLLQQIMFYKELGYSLSNIKDILINDEYDLEVSLLKHLKELTVQKNKIDDLILLVQTTLQYKERNEKMDNDKKFEAFKDKLIQNNTDKYGEELNQKYDSEFIKQSNKQLKNKSKYQMEQQENLNIELNEQIIKAFKTNDPTSDEAMKMCKLHQKWLMYYWPSYDKNQHLSLVEMYTLDERFTKYYDKIQKGSATFLYESMKYYIKKTISES